MVLAANSSRKKIRIAILCENFYPDFITGLSCLPMFLCNIRYQNNYHKG
jgi:hypothetical protein